MKILIKLFTFFIFSGILISCSKEDDSEPSSPEKGESNPPIEISEFYPLQVDLGDTIEIKGENFTRNFDLKLNDRPLKVILSNDSVIKFEVPYSGFNPFNFKVILNDEEAETKVFENPFQLYKPEVDSISTNIGFNDKVTIYGSHLTNVPNKTRDIVFINNEMIEVEFQSKDSIVFDMRFFHLESYVNDLLVQAQLQEVRLDGKLKIAPPEIEGVDKETVKVGDTIVVYGKYFINIRDLNKVYLDGNRTQIIEASKDSLWIKVPMGPYEDRQINDLNLKIYSEETSIDPALYLEDIWYLSDVIDKEEITNSPYAGNIAPSSFQVGNLFYINSFMRGNSDNFLNNRIIEYNPVTKELNELAEIPLEFENYEGRDFQIFPNGSGSNVFVYLSRSDDNFFNFNYSTGEIKALQDFPGENINEATAAVLGGKFYMGLGHTGSTSNMAHWNMYEYNVDEDSWTLHSKMPAESEFAYNSRKTNFKWNNELYTGNGGDRQYDFWKFTSSGFEEMKSIPNPISSQAYFKTSEKAFYYHQYDNEFWEYSKSNDAWNNRSDLAIGKYRFTAESGFVIGDFAYLIGYYNDYGYEESPQQNDIFILKTELSKLK